MRRITGLAVLLTLAALLAMTGCSGGGGDQSQDAPAYDPAVRPYAGDAADVLLDTPAADGRLPCGLFDLANPGQTTGWGDKAAFLPDWPDCPQDGNQIEMLCLDANAAWIEPQFGDVAVRPDGLQITWFSQQDGICGFFPAND